MRFQYKQGSAAVLGLAMALLAAAPAVAEIEGWYIIGSGYHTQLEEAKTDDVRVEQVCVPLLGCTNQEVERNYDAGFESDTNFGLSFGYDFSGPFRIDLELRSYENEIDRRKFDDGTVDSGGETVDTRSLAFNSWYDFNRRGALRPYLGLGLGYADVALTDGADDGLAFAQAGAGINWYFTDRLALDVGYRYFVAEDPEYKNGVDVQSEYQGQSYTVGLRFNFFSGGGAVTDSDGDGVYDRSDRCPGTPRGVTVDARGCAIDSDNDGVVDYKDQCPNTPPNTEVDVKGCKVEQDSDNDGVLDKNDQCPGTPAGQPVLETGCAVTQSQVLEGVTFELDSAKLTWDARQQCQKVARLLADSKGFDVEIQGHTDSQGSAAYNRRLSQQRADSFRQCLVAEGVNERRLTATGYGEVRPVDTNDTAAGRARNRRVELNVQD